MPAYKVEIQRRCAGPACPKVATHEVRNARNAVIGSFCRRHAEMKVQDLNRAAEAREAELRRGWS